MNIEIGESHVTTTGELMMIVYLCEDGKRQDDFILYGEEIKEWADGFRQGANDMMAAYTSHKGAGNDR